MDYVSANIQWRNAARGVAYFDMIVTILAMGYCVWIVIDSGFQIDEIKDDLTLTIVAVVTFTVVTLIAIWLCSILLTATKLDTNIRIALRRAKIWCGVSLFILISFGLSSFILGYWIVTLAVQLILRGMCIYLVWKYMMELVKINERSMSPVPTF